MADVIPVDLTKTGGRLLPPGGQMIDQNSLKNVAPAPEPSTPILPKEEKKEPAPETPAAKTICRHCGKDPSADPDHPSPEDLVEFAKTVWRDEPFRKSYTFYGGSLSVTFRTLTSEEAEAGSRAAMIEASKDQQATGMLAALYLMNQGDEYQFGMSIDKLNVGDKEIGTYVGGPPADRLIAVRKVLGSQVANQTAKSAYHRFLALTKKLIDSGSDPSFWPATPFSGQSQGSPSPATRG